MAAARLMPSVCHMQAFSALTPDVVNRIADHLTAEEWARGPALACKALRAGRLHRLDVRPGREGSKGLFGLVWAVKYSDRAKLMSLKLFLQPSDLRVRRRELINLLQPGSGLLSQVTAFQFGLEEGQVQLVAPADCQRWLLQRMLSLQSHNAGARVSGTSGAFGAMKHLALTTPWQPALLKALDSVAPTLETLCLQQYSMVRLLVKSPFFSRDSAPMDPGRFRSLKLLALHELAPSSVVGLPQGCQLYVCQRDDLTGLRDVASRIYGAALNYWFGVPRVGLQRPEHAREVTLMPSRLVQTWGLWLCSMSLHAFRNLSTLRVLCPLDEFRYAGLRDGVVHVLLPASLRLTTLTLMAPVVRLGFEDSRASAAWLTEMKVTCAKFSLVISRGGAHQRCRCIPLSAFLAGSVGPIPAGATEPGNV